jgi:hypothetical protein
MGFFSTQIIGFYHILLAYFTLPPSVTPFLVIAGGIESHRAI